MKDSRPRRILLLEDEAGDAHLMRLAFDRCGYAIELRHIPDGMDALRYLNENSGPRPDLILVDLKMPGMGGLEFLSALKQDERLRAIPAVVVSTSTLPADVDRAYRYGAAGYLLKIVDFNEFTSRIVRLCDYWFGLVKLPGEMP